MAIRTLILFVALGSVEQSMERKNDNFIFFETEIFLKVLIFVRLIGMIKPLLLPFVLWEGADH